MTIPSNVDIHFDDFCKGCNICEIDMIRTEYTAATPYFAKSQIYRIRCRNQDVCRMWKDKMRGEQNDK